MKARPWYVPFLALPLSLLSGVMLALALPPNDLSILAWFAFTPLILASRLVSRVMNAIGCGMAASYCCAMVITKGQLIGSCVLLVVPFGVLALVLGVTAGTASVSAKKLHPVMWPVFIASTGTAGEFLAANLFPVNVSLTQHANPFSLRLASVTGIWGVTFLIWFVSASFALVLCDRWKRMQLVPSALVMAAAVFLPFTAEPGGPIINVAAVQAAGPESAAEETAKLDVNTQIAVWPELGLHPDDSDAYECAKKHDLYITANFLEHNTGKKPMNCAYLISPDGTLAAVSYKQHLFGPENKDYVRGPVRPPAIDDHFAAGIPICFDTMFTDVSRRLVREGSEILLVPNYDPDMPGLLLNHLHTAAVAFRAAENAVPIVWSEVHGLSSIFDSRGKLVEQAPADVTASVQADVVLGSRRTIFNRTGDWLPYLCFILIVSIPSIHSLRSLSRMNHSTQ